MESGDGRRAVSNSEGAAAGIHSGLLLIAGGMESGDGRRAVFNFARKLFVLKWVVFGDGCLLLVSMQSP